MPSQDLDKKFSQFGRITEVRLVRDSYTNHSRGFAFVAMERQEDMDEVSWKAGRAARSSQETHV